MNVPHLYDRKCNQLAMVSGLRPLPARYKTDAAQIKKYSADIAKYIDGMNGRFIDREYIRLTGLKLDSFFSVEKVPDESGYVAHITITCPLETDYTVFKAEALSRWSQGSISAESVYATDLCGQVVCRAAPTASWWRRTFG